MAEKYGRINALIQKNLSEIILYELKSPVTEFASVNEVKVTTDYSYATIYVSNIDASKVDSMVSFLNNRQGKIRSRLAKKLDIYKIPELKFVKDDLFEKGKAREDLIDKALNEKPTTLKDVYGKNFRRKRTVTKKKKEETDMKKPSKKKTTSTPAKQEKKPAKKPVK